MLVDAATYVVSALSLARIRAPEPAPAPRDAHPSAIREAGDGLGAVWRDQTLRALVASSTAIRLAGGAFGAMYILYAVRDLGLSPTAAGLIAGCGGLGSLAGAALAGPAVERFGAKATMVAGFAVGGAVQGLVPLAHGAPVAAALYLLGAQLAGDGLMTMAFVVDTSVRQTIVPDRLLGRVSATANVLGVAAVPLGALAGGIVGQIASPRAALALAAVGFSAAALFVAAAPIRTQSDETAR
jgi:MFS family permease